MKKSCLKCIIMLVIICTIIALILQLVGLVLQQWMYAPSVVEVVDGKNVTFYSLRGLWQGTNRVFKYKIAGEDAFRSAGKYADHTFVAAVLGTWFDAVRGLEVVGAVINLGSMVAAVVWYFYLDKSDDLFRSSAQQLTFISLILGGSLNLLGVTILIGKIDPELASWGGAMCGFAGTFCIIGASFIRYWQQEAYR